MTRRISEIAREVVRDWPQPYFGARPYLGAMLAIDKISDHYGADSGESIVAYFLSNATTWRGETARRVKRELNKMVRRADK